MAKHLCIRNKTLHCTNSGYGAINRKRSLDIVAGKNGVEVTGSVLQYSLMSDCEIIPIARISAMYRFISDAHVFCQNIVAHICFI
jgi:hypothetical protein